MIFSRSIARKYVSILRIMGVEVNSTKSLISYSLCEFAKRYWYKGIGVTPVPLSGLIRSLGRVYFLYTFIESLRKIGWISQEAKEGDLLVICKRIFRSLKLMRQKRLISKLLIFLATRKVLHGKQTESEGLHALTDLVGLPIPPSNNRISFFALVKERQALNDLLKTFGTKVVQSAIPLLSPVADQLVEEMRGGLEKCVEVLLSFNDDPRSGLVLKKRPSDVYVVHKALTIQTNDQDYAYDHFFYEINHGIKRLSLDSLPAKVFILNNLLKGQDPTKQEEKNLKEIQIFGYKVISMIKNYLSNPNPFSIPLLTADYQEPEKYSGYRGHGLLYDRRKSSPATTPYGKFQETEINRSAEDFLLAAMKRSKEVEVLLENKPEVTSKWSTNGVFQRPIMGPIQKFIRSIFDPGTWFNKKNESSDVP